MKGKMNWKDLHVHRIHERLKEPNEENEKKNYSNESNQSILFYKRMEDAKTKLEKMLGHNIKTLPFSQNPYTLTH